MTSYKWTTKFFEEFAFKLPYYRFLTSSHVLLMVRARWCICLDIVLYWTINAVACFFFLLVLQVAFHTLWNLYYTYIFSGCSSADMHKISSCACARAEKYKEKEEEEMRRWIITALRAAWGCTRRCWWPPCVCIFVLKIYMLAVCVCV